MACVKETLSPEIQAMIQSSEQYRLQMEQLQADKGLSAVEIAFLSIGSTLALGLLIWLYQYWYKVRRLCSYRKPLMRDRKISDAVVEQKETSLTVLATRRPPLPPPPIKQAVNPLKAGSVTVGAEKPVTKANTRKG